MGIGLIALSCIRRELTRGGENSPMSKFYRTGRVADKKANIHAKDFSHNLH